LKNWSVWLDIKIIIRTIAVVFAGTGSYQRDLPKGEKGRFGALFHCGEGDPAPRARYEILPVFTVTQLKHGNRL